MYESIFFALAMIAGGASLGTGSPHDLQVRATKHVRDGIDQVNAGIKQKGLAWRIEYELAWGPVVYQAPNSDVADNVMYVVRNKKAGHRYTVAIAGTNFLSPFDWLVEDSLVGYSVPWIEGKPSAGRIALGTSIALQILKNLESVPSYPLHSSTPLTLRQYLKQQLGTKGGLLHTYPRGNVSVTGHSLGGALSPVVGLWLFDQTATDWPRTNFDVYTFAGPTPGDATFANFYESKLGGNTTRVWNQIDAVPHAWQQQASPELSEIPGLFENLPPDGKVGVIKPVTDLTAVLEYISRKTTYTQVQQADSFTVSTYADVTTCNSDLAKYFVQAVYQHINAYADHYKIPVPSNMKLTCKEVDDLVNKLSAKIQQELATIQQ